MIIFLWIQRKKDFIKAQRRHLTKFEQKIILNSIIYDFIFNNTGVNADIFWVTEKTHEKFMLQKKIIFDKCICTMYILADV